MSSVHKSTIENLQKKNSTSRERRNEPVLIGHLGAKKTEVRILPNIFWPGLHQGVIRCCHSCDVCKRTVKKGSVKKVPLGSMLLIDTPFRRVAVVIIGPNSTQEDHYWGYSWGSTRHLQVFLKKLWRIKGFTVWMHVGSIQTTQHKGSHQYTIPSQL